MATKFAQFLTDNKIDPRRLLSVSKRIEHLQPADRQLKFAKKQKKGEGAPAPAAAAEGEKAAKPRSGRPITPRLIDAASVGKPVGGPAKTRLLRAVNRILEQKKKPAVELKSVF